jgi:hypothetical protein
VLGRVLILEITCTCKTLKISIETVIINVCLDPIIAMMTKEAMPENMSIIYSIQVKLLTLGGSISTIDYYSESIQSPW